MSEIEPRPVAWNWRSLRELDEAVDKPKGSAFRAFKQLLPQLVEDQDFIVLDHHRHDGEAARWQAAGRLYRSSLHPVVVSPLTAERLQTQLTAPSDR